MRRAWVIVASVAVLGVALMFAITFRSARPLADATVRFRAGEVFVGGRPFDGTLVRQGAIVRTGEDGRIDIDVGPSVAVEAGANAEFTVPLGGAGAYDASIVRGTLRVSTVDARVILHAPHAVVEAASGTTLSVAHGMDGALVCVLRGSTNVAGAGTSALVQNGRVIRRGEIPSTERIALDALNAAARLR